MVNDLILENQRNPFLVDTDNNEEYVSYMAVVYLFSKPCLWLPNADLYRKLSR